jgi:hypothetical protein
MARVREAQDDNVDAGKCVVWGRNLLVDGQADLAPLTFTPVAAQLFRGVMYAAQPVTVTPDEQGCFEVALPPGRYTVDAGTWMREIVATAAGRVAFADVMQGGS